MDLVGDGTVPVDVVLERRMAACMAYGDGQISSAELDRRLARAPYTPPRPGRRLPPLHAIAAHWGAERRHPYCFRCGFRPAASTWATAQGLLHRAHLIDRWSGGLDLASNLVPLCRRCHGQQPSFLPGDEQAAQCYVFGAALGGSPRPSSG